MTKPSVKPFHLLEKDDDIYTNLQCGENTRARRSNNGNQS